MVWAGALAPILVLLATVAAWAIDTGAAAGEVLRNVHIVGEDVGGMGSDDLLERIESLDAQMGDRPVRIVTPEVTYETTAGEIGLSIDAVATAEAALDQGRDEVLPLRPIRWVTGFVSPASVELHYRVGTEKARTTIRRLEGESLVSPTEPTIRSVDGGPFEPVPGTDGAGIDPDTLTVALAAAAQDSAYSEPVAVSIRQSDLSPRLDDQVAVAAAESANEMTEQTMSITADGTTIQLVPRELRALAAVHEGEDAIRISLPPEDVLAVLENDLADVGVEPKDASFAVLGGQVVLEPGVTGLSCCTIEAAETVSQAFDAGIAEVTIDLTETEPELSTEEAEALGIVEEVGSPNEFGPTTRHACCQNRVTNIHRIADIVRGAIIEPGESFSINDYVGRRTIEKGFVSDGVIYDGVLTEDVGGGVSQFATTMFNAALFAGLEFDSYQSHSLYISRYPRGHEATISFPAPDLVIRNPTPYGVLIWPEYTDTSITVRLFSTRHIDVAVGEPTPSPQGNCTRWTTPRTRTYPDGTTETDRVAAVYRPEEGVNC